MQTTTLPTRDCHGQMAAARAAMAAKFPGMSPRQRADVKMRLALDWIYRWGWASPKTIERVVGASRPGLASRLVRYKLLKSTPTESAGVKDGVPSQILTLTLFGLQEIERTLETLMPYRLWGRKVRQDQLRLGHIAQVATLNSLLAKSAVAYETKKELGFNRKRVGQLEAVWTLKSGRQLGIQVVLPSKSARELESEFLGCISLTSLDEKPAPCELITVLNESNTIFEEGSNELGSRILCETAV